MSLQIVIPTYRRMPRQATLGYLPPAWCERTTLVVDEQDAVCINARTMPEPEPMHPTTMARNQLGLPGGTKAEYSPQQWGRGDHVLVHARQREADRPRA